MILFLLDTSHLAGIELSWTLRGMAIDEWDAVSSTALLTLQLTI